MTPWGGAEHFHHRFKKWPVIHSTPSHYLNKILFNINEAPVNTLHTCVMFGYHSQECVRQASLILRSRRVLLLCQSLWNAAEYLITVSWIMIYFFIVSNSSKYLGVINNTTHAYNHAFIQFTDSFKWATHTTISTTGDKQLPILLD